MAGEGIRFMQSMMELAKFRSEDGGNKREIHIQGQRFSCNKLDK